jgi:phospholipid transport system substrate-binding protein
MQRLAIFLLSMTIFVPLMLAQPARAADAAADPAAHKVEVFYSALVETMKQGPQLGLQGRIRQLTPAVRDTFDLPAMTQLSVGPSWQNLSEADRKSITDAFERMTVANYAKNFSKYDGEKFTVDPMVKMRNDEKIVSSKLTPASGSAVPFNYRMHQADGTWKIVDIYLNGYVSQLALRRADFASTIASAGAAGLVKKINDLVDKQIAGG